MTKTLLCLQKCRMTGDTCHFMLFCVITSEGQIKKCMCMHVCACLSAVLFLFMNGGVSASIPLIHHPAATGLSCDWRQHTFPPAKTICRPKLDSYRLWQGHRAVWHNIVPRHTHRSAFEWLTILTYAKTERHWTILHLLCFSLQV